MARLLYKAVTCGVAPEYARRVLATFPAAEPEPASPSRTQAPASGLIEPLSERELQVLRLLNTELSGPEIADELVIAVSTLRTHTQHIYGKLNANNRRAAVRRAKELGLI